MSVYQHLYRIGRTLGTFYLLSIERDVFLISGMTHRKPSTKKECPRVCQFLMAITLTSERIFVQGRRNRRATRIVPCGLFILVRTLLYSPTVKNDSVNRDIHEPRPIESMRLTLLFMITPRRHARQLNTRRTTCRLIQTGW